MVAAAIAGSAVAGIAGSAISGSMASKGQQQAAQTQQQAIAQQQAMAMPFVNLGQAAGTELGAELQGGFLGQPAPTDLSQIANMPGYQFTLQQGLLSTQNAAAARGLGVSGAALMGAANYSTGLAQANFQNYFNDYWANQNNRYNMLANLTNTGANAAVGAGSNLGQAAAAQGQFQAGAGNALASGIQGASGSLSNALMSNAILGQGGSTLGNWQSQPTPSTGMLNAGIASGGTYGMA